MPSIWGYSNKLNQQPVANHSVDLKHDRLTYHLETENFILGLRALKNGIGAHYFEFNQGQLVVGWFGDIYSCNGEQLTNQQYAEQLQSYYAEQCLVQNLPLINGYFVGFIFDNHHQLLHLFNDRYGLKPLYYYAHNHTMLAFSSQIKNLFFSELPLNISDSAVNTYLDIGHLLGEQTLFKGVHRLKPAMLLTINLATTEFTQQQYWQWNSIKPDASISFEQASTRLAALFEQAVARCLSVMKQDKLAITLSGGLDSRALLAAAKKHFNGDIHCFTFGEQGCDDEQIAKQVCELAQVPHTTVEINQSNWFEGREQGVWLTDGQKNILHMHALSAVDIISNHSKYLLNGFLGDVTLGGSYLAKASAETVKEQAQHLYQHHASSSDYNSCYFSNQYIDSLAIYNRGSRFIAKGSDLLSHKLQNLKPFMDYDLVDFVYSLPESYRKNGKLYHHMLLTQYPEYFNNIPWQQTGKPISIIQNESQFNESYFKQLLKKLLVNSPFETFARKLYRKLFRKIHYVAYDNWLREPEFKRYVERLINQSAILNDIIGQKKLKQILNDYYQSHQNVKPETIGALITLAIYFKQSGLEK